MIKIFSLEIFHDEKKGYNMITDQNFKIADHQLVTLQELNRVFDQIIKEHGSREVKKIVY